MVQWFPPLEGRHLAGWVGTIAVGAALISTPSKLGVAYGGFAIGFCLIWAWIRWRYKAIEFRTAIDEVSGQ